MSCGKQFNALRNARYCSVGCSRQRGIELAHDWFVEHSVELSERNKKWHAEHPDKMRGYRDKWAAEHPVEAREFRRKWVAEHSNKVRESNRKWAGSHRDAIAAYKREYNATERGIAASTAMKHNRRVKLNVTPMTIDIALEVQSQSSGYCPYCGDKIIVGEVDHIIPVASGGSNARFNLAWVCKTCNRAKHDRSVPEFLLYRQVRRMVVNGA